jgi:Arc/MetJ-type ribon-helix-helix transcriptional regulator
MGGIKNHMMTSTIDFLKHLIGKEGEMKYHLTLLNDQPFVEHTILQQMIERLEEGLTAVFPFSRTSDVLWLCLQRDEQALTIDFSSLKKFIVPYAIGNIAQRRNFVPDNSELGRMGSERFPNGYYLFVTKKEDEQKVWGMLTMWLTIQKRKPTILWNESVTNAYTLRNKFRNHIELKEWSLADKTLDVIREGHYVSDENYLFLSVELLSAQNNWKDIWYWKEFDTLSGLQRIPKDAKVALLSSFYFVNLAETDITGAYESSYEIFRANRIRLNTLLESHLGIEEEHVFRIFAYEALYENNLEKILFIKEQVREDETLTLISYLESKFIENKKTLPTGSPEEQASEYVNNRQYDDAYLVIKDHPLSKEKVRIFSTIGFFTGANEIQKQAYELFLNLGGPDQEDLLENELTKPYITFIKMVQEGTSKEPVQKEIELTWNHWFKQVLEKDEDSLDSLFEILNDQVNLPKFIWSPSMISELGYMLVEIALESFGHKKTVVLNEGIAVYIAELVRDEEFPRQMATELYSYSVEILLRCKKNEMNTHYFNRLLEGLMLHDVQEIEKFWDWAAKWYDMTPRKVMLPHLHFTIELFFDSGQVLEELISIWNQWTSTLLNGLSTLAVDDIREWARIGEFLNADDYLLQSVKALNQEEREEQDFLSLIPETSIAIFTLRENSARRAAQFLSTRNPKLKIAINVDMSLTKQAKSLASHADVPVLVTTAMKHALFYGITPYLRVSPVFPKSSGTSSIVSEIENHFAQEKLL